MCPNREKDLLISRTGTYRSIGEPRIRHRRDGGLPGDLGVRGEAMLGNVINAVETAVASGRTALVSVPLQNGSGETGRSVFQVRPAREPGWAVVSKVPLDQQVPVPDRQVLGQLFELTPTEAALAIDLMVHEDANSVAKARGISVETVRMHVKNILRKTGMSNQKKLMGLLTRLAALSGLAPATDQR